MDFPRTYERMAIWSAMPTSLLGAGLGAGSGSSFLGSILLGAGSMSALRNSSHWNLELNLVQGMTLSFLKYMLVYSHYFVNALMKILVAKLLLIYKRTSSNLHLRFAY